MLSCLSTAAAADLSKSEVSDALGTIKRVADNVAAGKYTSKAHLRGPARTIAIQWAKVEPVLIHRGYAIVETRFANRSIVAFERNWKSPAKARTDAKDVSHSIANLLSTRRQFASPAPSPK